MRGNTLPICIAGLETLHRPNWSEASIDEMMPANGQKSSQERLVNSFVQHLWRFLPSKCYETLSVLGDDSSIGCL